MPMLSGGGGGGCGCGGGGGGCGGGGGGGDGGAGGGGCSSIAYHSYLSLSQLKQHSICNGASRPGKANY